MIPSADPSPDLARDLAARDAEIARLGAALLACERASTAGLDRAAIEAAVARHYMASLSWRVTRPLRVGARLVRGEVTPAEVWSAVRARVARARGNPPPREGAAALAAKAPALPRAPLSGLGGRPLLLLATHDCSRTGAPVVVLNLLKRLRALDLFDLAVVAKAGGHLAGEMAALAPTILLDAAAPSARLDALLRDGTLPRPVACIASTVLTGDLVPTLRAHGVPVLCLVHEMVTSILAFGQAGLRAIDEGAGAIVFGSAFVRDPVAETFRLGNPNLRVVPTGYPAPPRDGSFVLRAREDLRRAQGWPGDALVVLGCGTRDARKGTDLFVQVARTVAASPLGRGVRFLWVGGPHDAGYARWLRHDLAAAGLEGVVALREEVADVAPLFAGSDVFALTSREDPFPLVNLAALAAGLPVIAFAGAGGAPETLTRGAGITVPYLDTATMAGHVLALAGDPGSRARLGEAAARRFDEDYTIDVFTDRLLAILRGDLGVEVPAARARGA